MTGMYQTGSIFWLSSYWCFNSGSSCGWNMNLVRGLQRRNQLSNQIQYWPDYLPAWLQAGCHGHCLAHYGTARQHWDSSKNICSVRNKFVASVSCSHCAPPVSMPVSPLQLLFGLQLKGAWRGKAWWLTAWAMAWTTSDYSTEWNMKTQKHNMLITHTKYWTSVTSNYELTYLQNKPTYMDKETHLYQFMHYWPAG